MTMMRNRSPLLHLSLINVASDIPRFMATRHSDDNIGKKFVPTAATKPRATAASVLWKDMLHLLNRQLRAHNTTFWVCMRKMRFCSENSRNFLFGLENGSDHTPIPPLSMKPGMKNPFVLAPYTHASHLWRAATPLSSVLE